MPNVNPYIHLGDEKELRSLLRMAKSKKDETKVGLINEAIAALTPYHSGFLKTEEMSKVAIAITKVQGILLGSVDQKTITIDDSLVQQIQAAGAVIAKFNGPPKVRERRAKAGGAPVEGARAA